MKKKWQFGCYRNMRTTQEKRMYYAHCNDVNIRGKRTPKNLADPYDDIYFSPGKNWKRKRKTQYRNRRDLTKHIVYFPSTIYEWVLEEYFQKYNIPHTIVPINTQKREVFQGKLCYYNIIEYYKVTYWSNYDLNLDFIYRSTMINIFH